MHDAFGALLYLALDEKQPRPHHLLAVSFECRHPQHDVADAGLVGERDEDRFAFAGPLTDKRTAGAVLALAVAPGGDFCAAYHAFVPKRLAQELHGVAFERKPHRLVVGEHMFAERHRRQWRVGFLRLDTGVARGEQWQFVVTAQAPHRPECFAPVEPQRAKRVGFRQQHQRAFGKAIGEGVEEFGSSPAYGGGADPPPPARGGGGGGGGGPPRGWGGGGGEGVSRSLTAPLRLAPLRVASHLPRFAGEEPGPLLVK